MVNFIFCLVLIINVFNKAFSSDTEVEVERWESSEERADKSPLNNLTEYTKNFTTTEFNRSGSTQSGYPQSSYNQLYSNQTTLPDINTFSKKVDSVGCKEIQSSLAHSTSQKKRRPRTAINEHQKYWLNREFDKDKYPTDECYEVIANNLNLEKRVVKTWFQNTRAKQKRLQNIKRYNQPDQINTPSNAEAISSIPRPETLFKNPYYNLLNYWCWRRTTNQESLQTTKH